MGLIKQPFIQVNMADGAPYAGAKAYFYVTGTTTAAAVYQDSALATPHAVPVVADAEGRFPAIYAPDTPLLRMKIISSTGSLVSPLLDIDPMSDAGAPDTVSLTKRATVSPISNITVAAPATSIFDGVSILPGTVVFLKSQTTASQNGVYQFNGPLVPMTRLDGSNTSGEMPPDHRVTISQGTVNKDRTYQLVTDAPITLDITSLTYVLVSDPRDNQWAIAGGTANALTLTLPLSVNDYPDGMVVRFRGSASNTTGAPTLTINGYTTTIVRDNGQVLVPGDIRSLGEYSVRYDRTNTRWGLLNPSSAKGGRAYSNAVADPTGTTSTAAIKMMGAGGTWTFTPSRSGITRVRVSGVAGNSTANDGCVIQARYGTGAAPANGAAQTGTQLGRNMHTDSASANQKIGFNIFDQLTLTPGTQYWFDIGLAAVTGGTASVLDLIFEAVED